MYRFLIATVWCAALAGTAQAAPAKAWVWADKPTAGKYTPSMAYQYNSGGGTNEITRGEVGVYAITLPGVGVTPGGTFHVTAYAGNHYCKIASWGGSPDLSAVVKCYTPRGTPIDGRFTAVYYRSEDPSLRTARNSYVWADKPSIASYTPMAAYSFNSLGGAARVARKAVGHYEVSLAKLDRLGNIQVTAYGAGPERCSSDYHKPGSATSDAIVTVRCWSPATSSAADAQFTVSWLTDHNLGATNQGQYGLSLLLEGRNASVAPQLTNVSLPELNPATVTARRVSRGNYEIEAPTLVGISSAKTAAVVTSRGVDGEYCTVTAWLTDTRTGAVVKVACFDKTGVIADGAFSLLFVTSYNILL